MKECKGDKQLSTASLLAGTQPTIEQLESTLNDAKDGRQIEIGPDGQIRPLGLRDRICEELNRVSAENGSNTPDFILAEYLLSCLGAFDRAVSAREAWYGRGPNANQAQAAPSQESETPS